MPEETAIRDPESLAQALQDASSDEQRAQILESYVETYPAEFERDGDRAAELIHARDLVGLSAHVSRHARARAEAKAHGLRRQQRAETHNGVPVAS
jgi:hypothetical protein